MIIDLTKQYEQPHANPQDTIVMSVRVPVGSVNITKNDIYIYIGRGLAGIIPKEGLYNEYLYTFLRIIQKYISGKDGAIFASISRE